MSKSEESQLLSLSEWVSVMAPLMEAGVRLLGFKDFNHYMQVCELVALANAKERGDCGRSRNRCHHDSRQQAASI